MNIVTSSEPLEAPSDPGPSSRRDAVAGKVRPIAIVGGSTTTAADQANEAINPKFAEAYRRMPQHVLKRMGEITRYGDSSRWADMVVHRGTAYWVEVADERAALVALAALGLRVSPGSPFMVDGSPSRHIRVTTGVLDEHDLPQLAQVIAALASAAKAGPSLRGV